MIKFFSRSIFIFALLFSGMIAFAQDEGFHLTLADEQNIGFDCPIASAVHPTSGELWVLMDQCNGGDYHLQAFDLVSGEIITERAFTLDAIDGDRFGVESAVKPMIFLNETTLEIVTYRHDDYNLLRFEVDIETGAATLNVEASGQLTTVLLRYSDYGEYATLSPSHQYAFAVSDEASYLINSTTGELLKSFESSIMFAAFSADEQFVYFTTFEDVEDYENFSGVLEIYDVTQLPDAEPLQTSIVPSVDIYPSPNGEYLAIRINARELVVVAMDSQAVTPSLEIWEPERQALTCVNSGADLSTVDFTTSGRLRLTSLQWLPDSSGFVTLNSYGGEGAGGGRPCYFNYSRLRHYQINGG